MNSKTAYTFIIISILSIALLHAQPNALKFDRISVSEGLSHVTVNCIYQDSFGLVWLGTTDGLNLYDGYEFIVYKSSDNDAFSIKDNSILTIHEDTNQNMWIGTSNGLYRYDRKSKGFIRIRNELEKSSVEAIVEKDASTLWIGSKTGLYTIGINDSTPSLERNFTHNILSLLNDEGKLWIGTVSSGLFSYEEGRFEAIELEERIQIRSIAQDKSGSIWVGTEKFGVIKTVISTDSASYSYQQFLPDKEILAIEIDQFNTIWVGTAENGLYQIFEDGSVSNTKFDKQELTSISGDIIRSIHEDRTGNIWIGTWGNGFNIFSPTKSTFIHYRHNARLNNTLSQNFVHSVFETKDNQVWIGTKNGLNILNPLTHQIRPIYASAKNNLTNNYIKCIFQDSKMRLWVGTEKGLNLAEEYSESPKFKSIPQKNDITFVFEDDKNNIWVGAWDGLYLYDEDAQSLVSSIDNIQVLSIAETSDGNFWIGTYRNGLLRFNPRTNQAKYFTHIENDKFSLPNNRVWTILKDSSGEIWTGSFGGGLSKTIRNNGQVTFQTWTEQHGLSSNSIIGILEDENKRLWVSGNNGISLFDPAEEVFTNFYEADGLQGNHFNVAYCKSSNGLLYFGGDQGLTAFFPDSVLKENISRPRINNFELFNKPVKVGPSSILKADIFNSKNITLSHEENIFSFGFTDLSYSGSNSRFAYRLKNFNDEWTITSAQRRYVTYTNIPAGNYSFELKLLDKSGNLSSETDIKELIILPPWWEMLWFRLLFIAVIVFVIIIIFKARVRRIESQKRALEKSVVERTLELEQSKKQVENDKLVIEKSLLERESLLKEIHHRVKNNLQIIASLLYLQSGKFEDEDFKKVLEEGQGRVRSMALIHQKLYENDDLKSIPFNEYLNELVSEIRSSFGHEMAKVSLNIKADDVFFDVDTAVPLGLIVNELATNAFKYAYDKQTQGSFSISLTYDESNYTLNIKDDGKGIPEDIDIRKAKSLGLRLVRMLSQQLEGEFAIKNDNGTQFELKFAA